MTTVSTEDLCRSLATLPLQERNRIILDLIEEGRIDFVDFGTHRGAGILKGQAMGGKTGLGLDLSDRKVQALLAAGMLAYSGNVLEFTVKGRPFRFAICRHVLEHMPSRDFFKNVVKKLSEICSDYIFIEQPSFDHDDYLASAGFKISQSTLHYHTCRLSSADIVSCLLELGLTRFCLGGQHLVSASSSRRIFTIGNEDNRIWWTEGVDQPKDEVVFKDKLYGNIVLVVALDKSVDPRKIALAHGAHEVQFESFF